MDLLRRIAVEQDAAIIVVTHDEMILDRFDHIFHLRDGRLEREESAGGGGRLALARVQVLADDLAERVDLIGLAQDRQAVALGKRLGIAAGQHHGNAGMAFAHRLAKPRPSSSPGSITSVNTRSIGVPASSASSAARAFSTASVR